MRVPIAFAVTLLLAGSSTALAQDVRFNFDKQTNFGGFKTYRWVVIKGAQQPNSLTDRQIRSAIDVELSQKGLTEVDGDAQADLLIGYQVAIDTEKQYTSFDTGFGYGPGWYGGGWYGHGGGGMTTGSTSTIYVGQVVLDMYTQKPQALVWRGVVSKTIDTDAKPEKQQKNLAKSMKKMLKNYPPKAKD